MSSVATIARALLYLRVTTLAGGIKSRLKRLRQPKYLVGALVGAAYIYFMLIRRAGAGGADIGRAIPGLPAGTLPMLAQLGAAALLAILLVNWAIPRRSSLAFSEAEIAFLFPAPVNRRMLIHYRLLGSQLGIVFSALVLTVVLGRGSAIGGSPWFQAIGWWIVLATLNLHLTGTAFVYSKLLNRSITTGSRRAVAIASIWLLLLALVAWIGISIEPPQASATATPRAITNYLESQLHAGPLPWLLALPRFLVAPFVAQTLQGFLLSLVPALAVLLAHYFWVVHTEVSFEEASIARAEKQAARIRAVQQGDWRPWGSARKAQPAPFNLRSTGRPEVAFLWKNLLSTGTFFRPKVALVVLTVLLIGWQWLVREPALEWVRLFAVIMFGWVFAAAVFLGPMITRQDLREDLPNADILKTYPLRGWQIVLGEIATPVIILTVLIWLCVLAVYLLLPAEQWIRLAPSLRAGIALAMAVLAPQLAAIQLLVPNAAAIILPAWAQSVGNRAENGIEVLGQRLIFVFGQLLITALALTPATIVGVVTFFIAQWLAGFWVAAVGAIVAITALLVTEAWLAVRWLGNRFEAFDLSAELRA